MKYTLDSHLALCVDDNGSDGGTLTLVRGKNLIGRSRSSSYSFKDSGVSDRHFEIIVSDQEAFVRIVDSAAELMVNGKASRAYGPLLEGDCIAFGNSRIDIVNKARASNVPKEDAPLSEVINDVAAPVISEPPAETASEPPLEMEAEAITAFKKEVHQKVLKHLDMYARQQIKSMSSQELRQSTADAARKVIKDEVNQSVPKGADLDQLIDEIVAEAIGLGPLEPLLADESVTEVMVNHQGQIYVERAGKLQQTPVIFSSNQSLIGAIERIVTPLGRRIDEGSPMVDARLEDGSRVNAVIPPLALKGPCLTIRKFAKKKLTVNDLVSKGTLTPEMAKFLEICVKHRKNVLVSGGTGSGKTTTLNILSNFIPDEERIVTIEDAAELQLSKSHVVTLESRPPNVEGKGEVSIRDLVRNSLRMRPDRIVVGECRGGEALDMLQAMNTGHDGSLTTGHANSTRDFLSRLEVMVLMSGVDLPIRAIREQIASAVDIVVQINRFSDGVRRVTEIVEVDGMEKDTILMQRLFEFKQTGVDAQGNVVGEHTGCNQPPSFYNALRAAGVDLDRSIFKAKAELTQQAGAA